MTDAELTAAYTAYSDMVYRIALVQTRNQAQAEDIQQDVFMALVRYSDRIRSEEHLKAWLIRVTRCACKKLFRSAWFRRTVSYDDELYKEEPESGELQPEEYFTEGDERLDILVEEVQALPEKMRLVVHLFYFEEMKVREIARALDLTEQNVKTRLSRARDKLREMVLRREETRHV